MEIVHCILAFIGWILLYFLKKFIYKLMIAVLHIIFKPIDYVGIKLQRVTAPIKSLGFPRILLNVILVCFSVFMIATEFSQLNTSMVVYFGKENLDIFPIAISKIIAIAYIAITLILGIIGLELIGFRVILLNLLFEKRDASSIAESWYNFGNEIKKPLTLFKVLIGIVLLGGLFYFADLQGKLAIDREHFLNPGKTIDKHINVLLYALGFSIPILAGVTFMSLEIFVATVTKILTFGFDGIQKGMAITYDISKRTIEAITSPIVLVTAKINLATDNKYNKYMKPMEVKSILGDINEIAIFRNYNKDNKIADELATKIADKIENSITDNLDFTIDELF
jgi:hypothetical protein